MDDKIFINGVFLREKTFENGGSIINMDIVNVNEFGDQLQKHAKGDGKITLEIKSRREKADNGLTHYIEVSQFVPKEKSKQEFKTGDDNDDVPF